MLDGLSVPDPIFQEWLRTACLEIEDLACDAMARAADIAADSGRIGEAINFAKRLVSIDPIREDAHRRLMLCWHRNGERAAALRQYKICAKILKDELQVLPDAATQALYDEIRRDRSQSGEMKPVADSSAVMLPEQP